MEGRRKREGEKKKDVTGATSMFVHRGKKGGGEGQVDRRKEKGEKGSFLRRCTQYDRGKRRKEKKVWRSPSAL